MENNNQNKNGRKKIAMFCHDDPLAQLGSQESGGQAVYVNSLIKELDKKGWSVDVFTRRDSQHKKFLTLIGKRSRLVRLKAGPSKYISRKLLFDFLPEMYESFINFIKNEDLYDIYHSHYWDGGWMGVQASQKFQKPLVHNFHSLGKVRLQIKEKYSSQASEKDVFDKRFSIEDQIIKNSNIIITLSESEKFFLQEQYNSPIEKIALIPGGVDLKVFKEISKLEAKKNICLNENDFVVLFVGRMEWRKGIGTLIHATNLLKDIVPNLKVLIIGGKIYGRQKNVDDYKEYQRLLKTAKDLGIDNFINFLGCVDHNRLPLFYSAANIFVVPSYYEPFGLVALESMACKTPVIASDVGGLATIIQNNINGLLSQPRNPVDLKTKIAQLYTDRNTADLLAINAQKIVINNYSWKSIAGKISDIYNKLIMDNNHSNNENTSG